MSGTNQIGVVGLGVMGENLARNMESHGYRVAGYDLDETKRIRIQEKVQGLNIFIASSLLDFLASLESPKRILIMVPAGKAVDAVIDGVVPHLDRGDILLDGGNTYFEDTVRRMNKLREHGVLFVGTGVSGGEEGALKGPSIMPGGDPAAWEPVKPILQSIAAKTEDGTACCEWIGEGGAGHFVKMVHNGIEYGDMQMICEAYQMMTSALGMSAKEIGEVFQEWNQGELKSYLIEITGIVLSKTDPETGKPLVDVILDTAGQKGTGKWTSTVALDMGIPAQTIADAVFARMLSALKEERVAASKILRGPTPKFTGDRKIFIEKIRKALYCSKICSYAQGFQLMKAASDEYSWNLNYAAVASLWRAGCIIRAQFLGKIHSAFSENRNLPNLLLNPFFANIIETYQSDWREVVAAAALNGVPMSAFMSAISYYDSYRSERLPANLLQAQRDYFGAHTYERIDKPRKQFFHTDWQSI